ncbi:MAG: arginine--tRNA ligase [Myxococcota bacterium]
MRSVLHDLRIALSRAVAEALGLSEDIEAQLPGFMRTPEKGRGDLALPCFQLAKILKEAPPAIAPRVAEALAGDERWTEVEVVGPYVNVTFATSLLAETVVTAARAESYGNSTSGAGRRAVVDYSSPNIAKPLGYHHLRSAVIGAAIVRLHRACGWQVYGVNYLGDWGKQFGLLATGFQRHGDPERRKDAKHLVEVYVKANAEADVGRIKQAMAAPADARAQADALQKARNDATHADDPKDKKKAKKSVKSLEKKLRGLRKMAEGDPLEDFDDFVTTLQDTAKEAEQRLPAAEKRDAEARAFLKRMEEKEADAIAEWKAFRQSSIEEFDRVYSRMSIRFEGMEGESFYQDVLEDTVARIRQKPGTRISEGAEVVDMPAKAGEPPAMLKTSDGTSLYLTRDIAAAIDRFERFAFDRSLYVVAHDQSLHFDLLFRTLDAMGLSWADRCHHVTFGRVHGMATRKGQVVFLDEVLDQAVDKARAICKQSDRLDPQHMDETVEAIGVGSIIFGDLRNLRNSDYEFKYEDVLDFSGHTGPYVQFSHARACSILEKGGGVPAMAALERLVLPEERTLIMALARYPEAVEEACEQNEPSLVTRALLDVAGTTASYLTAGNRDKGMRVLVEGDAPLRAARLQLVDGVRHVLAHGLQLLGVHAPTAM